MSKKITFSDGEILKCLRTIPQSDSEADNLSDTSEEEYIPNIIQSSSSESEDDAMPNTESLERCGRFSNTPLDVGSSSLVTDVLGCEECEEEKDDLCPLHPLTLILDIPVCRDGSVPDRAIYTAPWPLTVTRSKIQLGKGVWTRAVLPTHLLFGPYEGVYSQEKQHKCLDVLENDCSYVVHLINKFINTSDSSFSNWLSFVATTSLKHLANLVPILYKGSIFYKTIKSISKDAELLLWTGKEKSSEIDSANNCDNDLCGITPSLDISLQCPWCKLRFVTSNYLSDHKKRCSLSKAKSIGSSQPEISLNEPNYSLRRSKRKAVKTIGTYSLLNLPPSTKSVKTQGSDAAENNDRSYVCAYCGGIYNTHDILRRHIQSHAHNVPLFCSECGLKCCDKESLNRHIGKHNRSVMDYPEELTIDRSIFSSEVNKSPVLVEKDYNYHLGNEMSVFDLPWVTTLLKMNKAIRQNKSSSLRCSSCHMQFYNHFAAAIHERKCMEGRKPYKCGHCGKRFQLYFSIVKHMSKHEDAEKEILVIWKNSESVNSSRSSSISSSSSSSNNSHSIADKTTTNTHEPLNNCIIGSSLDTPLLSKNFQLHFQLKDIDSQEKLDEGPLSDAENESRPLDNEFVKSMAEIEKLEPDVIIKEEENSSDISRTFSNLKQNYHLSPDEEELKRSDCFEFSQNESSKLDTCKFMTKIGVSDSNYGGRRRRHECNICGQRFYRRKHIKKHMELHESETSRVYKCSRCNLWFGCSDMVKNHEQTAHANEPRALVPDHLTSEQSFLRKLLTVLAKEGNKGKYSDYFNAKETLKDKKFECEICSKRFTSFYRVRKHKIITHNELMDMLETANELSSLPMEYLRESNILAILSSIREETVTDTMFELKDEEFEDAETTSNEPEDENTRVAEIQLTLLKDKTQNNKEISCSETDSKIIIEDGNVGPRDESSDPSKSTLLMNKNAAKIFVAKNLIDGQPTSGKFILPKGIEFQQFNSSSSQKEMENSQDDSNPEAKYVFARTGSDVLNRRRFVIPSGKINLKRVIHETFANASYDSIAARKRQVYDERDMKQCKMCGKKLSPKTNMKTHMQSHTGERHYECQYCHKMYSLLSTLKRHIRIHTGDRPFKCNLCDKAYTQSSNLKRHYRQHTGERPFSCTFCPRRYAEKFSLNRHLKKHKEAKAYKCHVCRKGFSEQYLLVRHLQGAHNRS